MFNWAEHLYLIKVAIDKW